MTIFHLCLTFFTGGGRAAGGHYNDTSPPWPEYAEATRQVPIGAFDQHVFDQHVFDRDRGIKAAARVRRGRPAGAHSAGLKGAAFSSRRGSKARP